MTDKVNYNLANLMGGDVDDMDYVEEFGLDPALAYTPALNQIVLARVEQNNIDSFIAQGKSENEAKSEASKIRTQVEADLKRILAAKGLLNG